MPTNRKYRPDTLLPVLRSFVDARNKALDMGFTDNGGAIHSAERILDILAMRICYPHWTHSMQFKSDPHMEISVAAHAARQRGEPVYIDHVQPRRAFTQHVCKMVADGASDADLIKYIKKNHRLVLLTEEETEALNRANRSRMDEKRLTGIEMMGRSKAGWISEPHEGRPVDGARHVDDGGLHRLAGLLPGDLLPRAMNDPGVVARRRALLASRPPHMATLISYVTKLRRQQPTWEVPDFDPAGGGAEARVLFLFEKPGPKTAATNGSGFLSIHNDDPTAEATYRFALERNRLPMHWCLFANVIPWWDGTRKISPEQRLLSAEAIEELLHLLPELRAIVLVGGTAQRAWKQSGLQTPAGVKLWRSDHPSPLVRARHRARWEAIPSSWPDRQSLSTRQRSRRERD